MESSFLLERKIISLAFNTIRDTVFILSKDTERIALTEEDLTKNIILRRFKLLKNSECHIQNTNFKIPPRDTYEGYTLYFWELTSKIFVIYPFGYISIFDYTSGQLLYHFQAHGKKTYVVRNIIGSPMQSSLFISAQGMRNVYHINYENLKMGISYQKLILPKGETVFDIVCHPNEKFIFVACSDSIIHVFDYSDIAKIKEVRNGVVDFDLPQDGKPLKNQAESIKKKGFGSVITIDINSTGNFLLSGNENGTVYLWDAFLAMKEKKALAHKERVSCGGILALKFIKTKQFENLERFTCLTKEGQFFIYSIINVESTMKSDPNQAPSSAKIYTFKRLYEHSSLFNPIIYSLTKYNLITSNFICCSYFTNVISLSWPNLKIEKIKVGDKYDNYLLFTNFSAKFFFLYDNDFPKINFPLSTQMKFRSYEDFIPSSNKQLVFEGKIYMIDNFFIYFYDLMTGTTKKLINYPKEFNFKNVLPLRFEVKPDNEKNLIYFFVVIENENNNNYFLMLCYDTITSSVKQTKRFDRVSDIVLLGENPSESDYIYMIIRKEQNGILYCISEDTKINKNIDGDAFKIYHTPFNEGYCVLYRNGHGDLKFSKNLKVEDKFSFESITDNIFKLEFSEREVDIVFNTTANERIYCAISMIEKIIITDEKMKPIYTFKTSLRENPNIISSMFWIGNTLIYTKGNSLHYFYGKDNINQKIFTNNRPSTFIAGVLSDRFILVSRGTKDINSVMLTTPMINPLEPILIGYLDSSNLDYNLIRECVVNMFTNQVSQNLIDKFIKKDLKEVAWMFISDTKSSFMNIKKKTQILNDLLQFDKVLENIITNKDLKNELDLDELLWKFKYDHSVDYIKELLKNEAKVLMRYGQFDKAIKIMELLGQYPLALNLLLLSTTREEYEKLRIMFQAKNCLSFSDNILINNTFCLQYNQDKKNPYNMSHYNKVFDCYKGEPFLFGANQDKFQVNSIKNIENKISKKNSFISNITKKILTYGETPYSIYTNSYNKENGKVEPMAICSLILQKIEQFYGTKNTLYEAAIKSHGTKKTNFGDYSVPLTQMTHNTMANNNDDLDVVNPYEDEELDLDPNTNVDEISEPLYLSAYYHCDKGSGNIVEDITDNGNNGTIIIFEPPPQQMPPGQMPNPMMDNEENKMWTHVLDEFEPLEYEDKWGRKSPGPHSIKFYKKLQTKLIVKYSPSLSHLNKKFTIEIWVKLNSLNVTLLSKDNFNIEIQNGKFKINNNNTLLQGELIKDYSLPIGQFFHVTITYKKANKVVHFFVNCEEVVKFDISLDTVSSSSDLVFGNANLDAELTEIKIWNQEMPLAYIKENYRSPLPILAESKRKLRMKINKQDEGQHAKKKFEFNKTPFVFGSKTSLNQSQMTTNSKNMYDFNPGMNVFGSTSTVNEFESSVAYPSLNSVMEDSKSVTTINRGEVGNRPTENLQFGFKFDEINNQNFDMNMGEGGGANDNFNFQVNDDFNFDK